MIFALVGEESFLVQRSLQKLLSERAPPASRDFNLDTFEGGEVSASEVMEGVGTLPVLAPRRVVLIRDAHQLKKGEMEKLESFLPKIPETADLILVAEKVDRRLAFWQRVFEIGRAKEFRPLYEREIPPWIDEEAASAGYRVSPEAARWMVTALGTGLSLIHSTLEKLYLLKGEQKNISLEDVESSITSFSWKSVFDLAEAVGRKDLPQALKLFRRMFAAGESPVALLGQLAWHFRTVGKVKEGESGGVSPFFLKKYQAQANEFSWEALNQKRERLFSTDWALKGSPVPPALLFETLLIELCRPTEASNQR